MLSLEHRDLKSMAMGVPGFKGGGFEIVDFSVYFEGLCQECKKRIPKSIGWKGRKRKQSDNPIKRNLKKEDN
jgi:hypothetical protein